MGKPLCRLTWTLIGVLALAALLVSRLSAASPPPAKEQKAPTPTPTTVPFLHPPFARKYRVTSFFDHQLPDRAWDDTIVIFDGKQASAIDGILDRTATFRGGYWFASEDWYIYYDGHNAFDYGTGAGATILAAAPGEVVVARVVPSSCDTPLQYVCLQHANGYRTYYLHLEGIAVQEGEWVETGDPLGISGNSGCSLGPHLHFGVEYDGQSTDPYGWASADRPDPLIAFSGHAATWLWVPEEPLLASGKLADPPAKAAVNGSMRMLFLPDEESPTLERVEFLAFYGDQWHNLGSDADGSDGWTWTWDSHSAPEGQIWLHAWAVDREGRVGKGSPIRTDIVVDRSPPEGSIIGLSPESTAGSRLWLYASSRDHTSGTHQVTFLSRTSAAEEWQEIGQATQLGNANQPGAQQADGAKRAQESEWFFEWDASQVPTGTQIDLIARLADAAGNTSWTPPIKGITIDHGMPGGMLVAPQSGDPIGGGVELAFSPGPGASSIARVDFYVWYDGGWHRAGVDQEGGDGWSLWWDPAIVGDQQRLRVQTRVYDSLGRANTALPQATGLVLDRTPPSAAYIRPASGGVARPDVAQLVGASDGGSGVAGVEFFVNQGQGWLKIGEDRDPGGGWSLLWDAQQVPDGVVDFSARVYDRAGNEAWTRDVRNVALDRAPPAGGFTFPSPGMALQGPVTLTLNVTDTVSGLDRAIFYAHYDGRWHHLGADLIYQDGLSVVWDTSPLGHKEGVSLTAWVYDRAGNYAEIPYLEGLSLGGPGLAQGLPSPMVTPTLTLSPTALSPTLSPSMAPSATASPTKVPTPSRTALPTATPSPSPTQTPTGTPTVTATTPPTPTPIPQPTATSLPRPTTTSSSPNVRPVPVAFWYLIGGGALVASALLILSIRNFRRRISS